MHYLEIEPKDARLFHSSLQSFVGASAYDEDSLNAIRKAACVTLPEQLKEEIKSLRSANSNSGALLVKGLVINQLNLPPTPTQQGIFKQDKLCLPSEVVELGIALTLGEPIAYLAEKNGALIQHVFPVESERDAPSNESSASMLDLHTELVYSRKNPMRPLDADSPDFILLMCIRSDPKREASTLVVEISDLFSITPPNHLSVLKQPRFEMRAPYSFTQDNPDDRPWVGPVSIMGYYSNVPIAAFDLACGTRGIDDEANLALKALKETAISMKEINRHRLESGDLLILDNRRCAHGRSPFFAAFNGNDRWIQRIYVRRSLKNMQPLDANHSLRVF